MFTLAQEGPQQDSQRSVLAASKTASLHRVSTQGTRFHVKCPLGISRELDSSYVRCLPLTVLVSCTSIPKPPACPAREEEYLPFPPPNLASLLLPSLLFLSPLPSVFLLPFHLSCGCK